MKSKILAIFAVGMLAGPAVANASIISGSWDFCYSTYCGTYSFSGLDTSATYTNSTAGGFSVTTNFATSGTNEFTYDGIHLDLGANVTGEGVNLQYLSGSGIYGDWSLWSIANPFSFVGSNSGTFQYTPDGSTDIIGTATVTEAAAVPEPGTLALLGLGLAGLGFARRRKAA